MTLLGNYYGTPVEAGDACWRASATRSAPAHAGPLRARRRPRRGPAGPARGRRRSTPPYLRPRRARREQGLQGRVLQRPRARRARRSLTRVDPARGLPLGPRLAHRATSWPAASWPRTGRSRNDDFSVRWTGQLVPPVSGRYELTVTGDDGFRLDVDGKRVIDEWTTTPRARARSATLDLEAGKALRRAARVLRGRPRRRGPAGLAAAGRARSRSRRRSRPPAPPTSWSSWAASPATSKARR